MNFIDFLFKDLIDFERESSSYFNLDISIVVSIAFLLSEVLRSLNNFLAYFGVLVLFIVAFFEKKSDLVKFYCIEYGLLILVNKILLTSIGIFMLTIPALWLLFTILLFIFMIINLIATIYLTYMAVFKHKGWKIPWLGDFVLIKILKVNY